MATMTRQQVKNLILQSGEAPEVVLTRLKERGVQVVEEEKEENKGFVSKVKEFFTGDDAQAQEEPTPQPQITEPTPTSRPQAPTGGMNEAQLNTFRRLHEQEQDPARKDQLKRLLEANGGLEDLSGVVIPTNSITITETIPAKGFIERMQDRFMVRAANVEEILMETGTGRQTGVEGVFQTLGQGAGLFVDSLVETARSGFRALPDQVERPLRKTGRAAIGAALAVPGVQQGIQKGAEELGQFREEEPRAFRNVAATFNLIDAAGSATAIYKVTGAGVNGVKNLARKTKGAVDDVSKFVWSTKDEVLEQKAKAAGFMKRPGERVASIKNRWVFNREAKKQIKELVDNSSDEIRKAVDIGVDFGDAQTLTHSTRRELDNIAEMFSRANKKALGQGAKEVDDVVGEAFMQKVKFLENQRKAVASQLDDVAKSLPKLKDADAPFTILERVRRVPNMQNLKAAKAKGRWVLDFADTGLADDIAAQKVITDQFNKAIGKTYKGMHNYRTFLNNQLKKTSATRAKPVTLQDEMVTDAIRGGMLDVINGADDTYREVAKQFAIVENTLKPVRKQFQSVGLIRDLSDEILNIRSAQLMRRLSSNNRAGIQALLDQVDLVSSTFGLDDGVNVAHLQEVSNMIEKYYKTTRATTFAGQTAQGANLASRSGLKSGLVEGALDVARDVPIAGQIVSGVESLFPSSDSVRKALEELVQTLVVKVK